MRRLFLSTVLAAASAGSLAAQGALSLQGFGYPIGQLSTRAAGTAGALGETDAGSPLNPAALLSAGRTILSFQPGSGDPGCLDGTVAAYTDAVERVLGAPSGSLTLVDSETTREWLAPEDATPNGEGQQWTVRA